MRQTAELTGQSRALSELRRWLDDRGGSRRLVVEGPSGSGKSWLISELARYMPPSSNHVFIRAAGDRMNSGRPLLPLLDALARTQRIARVIKDGAKAGAQVSPFGTGSFLSFVVETALNWKERDNASLTPFLTPSERDILVELQLRTGKAELILVLENLEWWDDSSLDLLKLMLGDHLHKAFPFLLRTRFVAVIRSDFEPTKTFSKEMRNLFSDQLLRLSYCMVDDFKELLESLGMKSPPTDLECRALHNITQGHLGLALEIARLSEADGSTLVAQAGGLELEQLCSRLMTQRLDQLGERGMALADLLTQAAAIGLSFSRSEIRCLVEGSALDLASQIRDATALELINVEGDSYAFRHDLLQQFFADRLTESERDIHSRFAECLRKLRPGQYEARQQHLALAGDVNGAASMGAHACLSLGRDGRMIPERRLGLVEHTGPVAHFVDMVLKAEKLVEDGEYSESLRLLDGVDLMYPEGLLAEKAIVEARCSIKLLTQDKFQDAIRILAQASSVGKTEAEVWSRVMLTSVVAYAYAGDIEASKRAAFEIARWAEPRRSFDPDAVRILHRLKVKADLYLTPEGAAVALAEACVFFGPADGDDSVRDPVNYFIALTNLSGNEIMRGDFNRAYATAVKANRYLQHCRKMREVSDFPRMDMHVNNLIVAGSRAGVLDLHACIEAFGRLVESTPAINDRPLLESNCAVLRILAGDLVAAVNELSRLFRTLSLHHEFDAYYVYFIGNNLAGALFAANRIDEAKTVWKELDHVIIRLASSRLPYRKRHDIQSRCLTTSPREATAEVWENFIAKAGELPLEGPSWKFLGRGFLLSDLQYWSDD